MSKERQFAKSISIKKILTCEEIFEIENTDLTAKELKKGLSSGKFNIIQNNVLEPYLWVVNGEGIRVALLQKDGSVSGEKATVVVN